MTKPLSNDDLLALVARLQADNAALAAKASDPRKITMKVSDKGALSVYGLGRWPVTLYRSQWSQLLGAADDIRKFIDANAALLAEKS